MYRNAFVKNLNDLCKNKVITKIADDIGMKQQTLQRYLHNECEISLGNLCKIADYFGVSIDELVGRDHY